MSLLADLSFFFFKESWQGCFASREKAKELCGRMGSSFIARNLAQAVAGRRKNFLFLISW